MVDRAARYFEDFVEPNKKYRDPTDEEREWFQALISKIEAYDGDDEKEMQAMIFDVAKEMGIEGKVIFKAFYEVVLGQERGPRFGTLAKLVGKDRAIQMIEDKI